MCSPTSTAPSTLLEIDESYYGGRSKPESRGRGLTDPNISLMAIAIETIPTSTRQGERIRKSRFVAGGARIAVLPAATAAHLGDFVRGAAKPGAPSSPMVRRVTTLSPTASAIIRSFKTAAKNANTVLPVVTALKSTLWCGGATIEVDEYQDILDMQANHGFQAKRITLKSSVLVRRSGGSS